jgi:hypothetical protein
MTSFEGNLYKSGSLAIASTHVARLLHIIIVIVLIIIVIVLILVASRKLFFLGSLTSIRELTLRYVVNSLLRGWQAVEHDWLPRLLALSDGAWTVS